MIFLIFLVFLFNLVFPIDQTTLAGEGVIVVFDAPIFSQKDFNSPIVHHVIKGSVLMIHDQHFQLSAESSEDIFYLTMDNLGRKAYVPKKFVKLIYHDLREKRDPIRPFDRNSDPTDYRIDEPLPPHYPFIKNKTFPY